MKILVAVEGNENMRLLIPTGYVAMTAFDFISEVAIATAVIEGASVLAILTVAAERACVRFGVAMIDALGYLVARADDEVFDMHPEFQALAPRGTRPRTLESRTVPGCRGTQNVRCHHRRGQDRDRPALCVVEYGSSTMAIAEPSAMRLARPRCPYSRRAVTCWIGTERRRIGMM